MKAKYLAVAATCLFLSMVCSVWAEDKSTWTTGNDLLGDCVKLENAMPNSPGADAARAGRCLGEVNGVSNTMFHYKTICPPNGVSAGQTVVIVLRYLRAHPEDLHMNSSLLIMGALSEAFPCK
ncbi:MAG: hypothetical protein H6Q52_1729 [Deltaproteobacteria bacterium]|nr:hypothetical protein [Deltaproteobacteria bacterium]